MKAGDYSRMVCAECGGRLPKAVAEGVRKGQLDKLCDKCAAEDWGVQVG